MADLKKSIRLPDNYRLAYSAEQISLRVSELGDEIANWLSSQSTSNANFVAICVLRGGAFFFADLLRNLPLSIEPLFCRVKGYSQNANEIQEKMIIEAKDFDVKNRIVLIVDDICETGRTLKQLEELCKDQGARAVKSAVLIERLMDKKTHTAQWSAFQYRGDEWFVGYGMDDKNRNSNLPNVYRCAK